MSRSSYPDLSTPEFLLRFERVGNLKVNVVVLHPGAHVRIAVQLNLKEWQKIRWFQWEFLRRNHDYKRDYVEFMAMFGPWFAKRGFWYQLQRGDAKYTDRDLLFYYNSIWPALKKICAKWCISDLFSPEWTFDESGLQQWLVLLSG